MSEQTNEWPRDRVTSPVDFMATFTEKVANPLPSAPTAPFAHYTHAIVSGIPESLPASALRLDDAGGAVDLEAARRNHADYVAALRSLGIEVLVLEPEEDTPDCVFVEDAVVVGNGKAFITRPGECV